MISTIILVLSFIFDGVLSNFIPYQENNLSLFTPLLTIVSFIVIFPFFRKKESHYFIILFVVGLLYDLFYTNLLFFNSVMFLIVGLIINKISKSISKNFINIIIETIIVIVCYESLTALILFIYTVVPITINEVIYKITHSLLLNIIYVLIVEMIIKLLPKKLKNININ